MTSPATSLSALSDVGMRLNREPKVDKDEKNGGPTVTRYRALATVRVRKGHIRVHRDTCMTLTNVLQQTNTVMLNKIPFQRVINGYLTPSQ